MKVLKLVSMLITVLILVSLSLWLALNQGWVSFTLWVVGVSIGGLLIMLDDQFGRQWYQPLEDVALTRSSIFMVFFSFVSIFVLTTSTGLLGHGLVVGIWYMRSLTIFAHLPERRTGTAWLPVWARLKIHDEQQQVALTVLSNMLMVGLLITNWS